MKQRRGPIQTPFATDTFVGVCLKLSVHVSDGGQPSYHVTAFRNGGWQPVGIIERLAIDTAHHADADQFWYALLDDTKDVIGPYPSMRPTIEALAVAIC